MRDKIELLVEETGASPEEAELALGLAGFNVEEALQILQAKRRDILVLKLKFYNTSPHLYGLALITSNLPDRRKNPAFRLRVVLGANPSLYETSLASEWYEFEKEIYRARLSERDYVALSQNLEKEWERLLSSSADFLHRIRQAVEANDRITAGRWLESLMESSMVLRQHLRFQWDGEIMSLREFRQTPGQTAAVPFQPAGVSAWPVPPLVVSGDISLNLRVTLANRLSENSGVAGVRPVCVSDLKPGDAVFVYVLEDRDSGVYLNQLFGGLTEEGLAPIEVPVESVWEEEGLLRVRVRFAHAVTGEGSYPKNLRIASLPQN